MSELDEKTREQLREIASDLGLAVSGTKTALIGRIEAALDATDAPPEPTQGPQAAGDVSDPAPTVPELPEPAPQARKPRGPGLRRNQTRRIRLGHRS